MGKLQLLEFESRIVPVPLVTFHGGQVIQNVVVQDVFFGAAWRQPQYLQQAGWIQSAITDLVTGPYMDMLNIYGVGRGNVLPGVLVDSPPSVQSSVDDSFFQQTLNSFPTNPNTLYLIFTAPGMLSTFGPYSSNNYYLGYHYNTDSGNATYAVATYPGLPNISDPSFVPTVLGTITVEADHEIMEAVTDRVVNPVQTGWFADYYFFGSHYTAEVADLAVSYRFIYHQQADGNGGYWVQAIAGIDGQPMYPIS